MDVVYILGLIVTGAVGLLGWYFKRHQDHLDDVDKSQQDQINTMKAALYEYEIKAQEHFVTRDEFIRAISNQDKKLDKIYDEVLRLSGRKD
ncbi:MAG: hypothetical protein FWF44_05130 [Defluviitaleaceae bacterium]|nr:hypothetical protein [Defluviitaleaceae bacterium]